MHLPSCFFFLKARVIEIQKKKEPSPIPLFTPQMLTTAIAEPAKARNPDFTSGAPPGQQEPKSLSHQLAVSTGAHQQEVTIGSRAST